VILTFELEDLPAWQHEFLREGLALERDLSQTPSADTRASSASPHPANAPTDSSRPFGVDPRRCSIPPSVAPSRCGPCSEPRLSNAWCSGSPQPSSRARGTPLMAISEQRTVSTDRCAWWSQNPP
jgi:hypothetical protein